MSRRIASSLLLAIAALLTACQGQKEEAPQQMAQIELTHSWNVAPGKSLFISADMGTRPAENGDELMKVMPGVLHRIGAACQSEPELSGDGELVISFKLEGGAAKALTLDPESDATDCLAEALGKEAQAFAGVPDAAVLIRTSFAAAEPPPAG